MGQQEIKITKLVHSCLLVETDKQTVLFDPGVFSKDSVLESLPQKLDSIFITHVHPDHLDTDLIASLVTTYPNVAIFGTDSVLVKLKEAGIQTEPPSDYSTFEASHEGHAPFLITPDNIGIHFIDILTHPGDSHSFSETKDVLALPITAPWGSVDRAVQLALTLHPRYIIPIHDWHWKDEPRAELYERLESLFKEHEIIFIKTVNGTPFTLEV